MADDYTTSESLRFASPIDYENVARAPQEGDVKKVTPVKYRDADTPAQVHEREQLAASHGLQVENPPKIDRPPVVS